jgi:hypothetical protein
MRHEWDTPAGKQQLTVGDVEEQRAIGATRDNDVGVDGVEHTFKLRSMLVPTGYALYARECVAEGQEGYKFSILLLE